MPHGTPEQIVNSPILQSNGQPFSQVTDAVQGNMNGANAQYLKMGLDDMLNSAPQAGITGNELRAIQSTKGDYLSELEKQIPDYLQANKTYAELSQPINQSDILTDISNKSKNFRGDITPAAFYRAASDKTAQRVTGRKNITLEKSLTSDQLKQIESLKKSLLQKDFADSAGRGVGSNTIQNLAYTNMLDQAGIPSALRGFAPASAIGNIGSQIADFGYKKANKQLAEKLALSLLEPQQAAKMMQSTAKPKQSLLVQDLIKGLNLSATKSLPIMATDGN
jgi:hypothetical protein